MSAPARARTFSEEEKAARIARLRERVAADCVCGETIGPEGFYFWLASPDCPVHGEDPVHWWAALNLELDASWPGTWEGVTS